MRVAVLAHNLVWGGGRSVGRNIVALLPKLGPRHKYLIFVPDGLGYDLHDDLDHVTVRTVKRTGARSRICFELHDLPKQVAEFKADVVLSLGNIGLLRPPCKQAILIHQSQIMYGAKHHGRALPAERLRFWAVKEWVRYSLKRTQLIFCQTPVARTRFAEKFGYPLDQIKISPNAISEYAKMDAHSVLAPEVLQVKDRFTLFLLGTYSPHKNIDVLLPMFRQFPDQLNDVRCIITISAEQHKHAAQFLREVDRHKLQDKIVNVGILKQEELAGFFCHADALLFPTLLESFSGTYLEAMHFGLPIVTSDLDFAHYVCGECALYCNPWDPRDIVNKILMLKADRGLRAELVRQGSERLSSFFTSWEDIVSNMLGEIEKVCMN